jgi:hypothetical protein
VILAIALILLALLVGVVLLVRFFRSGEEAVRGGSFGRQFVGRNGEDWGPKSN